MNASKLREHLRTNEFDANKAWNKPAWSETNVCFALCAVCFDA